jgi:hypothetical protein
MIGQIRPSLDEFFDSSGPATPFLLRLVGGQNSVQKFITINCTKFGNYFDET